MFRSKYLVPISAFTTLLVLAVSPATAALRHQYLFDGGDGSQILDSQGSAHGTAFDAGFAGNLVDVASSRLTLDGLDDFGELPAMDIAINTYTEVSLESWFVQTGNSNQFSFLAGFGRQGDTDAGEDANLGYDYLMVQSTRAPGDQGSRGAISLGTYNQEAGVTDGARDLNDGQLHHVVMTVDSTDVAWYVDGIQIGTSPLEVNDLASGVTPVSLADVANDAAWLGRALYLNDPYFEGSIFEFSVWDNALSDTEVANRFTAGCVDSCGEPLRLEVDRATGVATFKNDLASENIVLYSVSSDAGVLDEAGWQSVADFGDLNSGGSIDADDIWLVGTENSAQLLAEENPVGSGGPADGFSVGSDAGIGKLWTQSPFEDLVVNVTTYDGISEVNKNIPVFYVGEGEPIDRSDFNADGVVDADDYGVLLSNHLQPLTAATPHEAYLLGDVDGDLDNDFDDFRLFKNAFIAANGAEAFAALVAIPEPATSMIVLVGLAVVSLRRVR